MLDTCETEKRKEVSHYQNEIQKIEEDIEHINQKLQQIKNQDILSEEAQDQLQHLQNFEQEAKQKLFESQNIIQPILTIDGQDPRNVIFNVQKEFNDKEYQMSQKLAKLKKQQEDEKREQNKEYNKVIQNKQVVIEKHRQRQYELEDKKNMES